MNRRKNKVLDIAYRQMTVALDTANDLENSIDSMLSSDIDGSRKIIKRLFKVEEEIDDLRRIVFEELTKGSLPQKEREDIMHLVKRLDMMADHIKNSARNVWALSDGSVPKEIWQAFHRMAKGVVETATMLKNSLGYLSDNPSKARSTSEKVEEKETEVDKIFLEIKSLLIKYGEKVNPAVLILSKDLLDSMEEAADSCADTADYIRILTVTFK
jgi:predicted phosphate transport protein (TIGR00153 family)